MLRVFGLIVRSAPGAVYPGLDEIPRAALWSAAAAMAAARSRFHSMAAHWRCGRVRARADRWVKVFTPLGNATVRSDEVCLRMGLAPVLGGRQRMRPESIFASSAARARNCR